MQKMMVAHGANEVSARIGTLRSFQLGNGDHSVTRGLELARMAKELGLPFNPEIGLFRSYGDPRLVRKWRSGQAGAGDAGVDQGGVVTVSIAGA